MTRSETARALLQEFREARKNAKAPRVGTAAEWRSVADQARLEVRRIRGAR